MRNKSELRRRIKERKENPEDYKRKYPTTLHMDEELIKSLQEELANRNLKMSKQDWKPEHKK